MTTTVYEDDNKRDFDLTPSITQIVFDTSEESCCLLMRQ